MTPIRLFLSLLMAAALVAAPLVGPVLAQENERTFLSEHFAISWVDDPLSPDAPDLTDRDADGVPDGVERVAEAFEAARSFELDTLGYKQPPGDPHYPLYVGLAAGRGYTQASPGDQRQAASFTVVPRLLTFETTPEPDRLAFAAHEYFHAIQNGYDAREDPWIREATAMWMQEEFAGVGPAANVLAAFIPFPRAGLEEVNGLHEYGASLFIRFLTERWPGTGEPDPFVRELWELMEADGGAAGAAPIDAIEEVLTRRGSSLEEAWTGFLSWRWDAARDGAYAGVLPTTERLVARSLPRVGSESCRLDTDVEGSELPPLSADYFAFRPRRNGSSSTFATLRAQGPEGSVGFLRSIGRDGTGRDQALAFGDHGVATASVPFGTSQVRRVLVGLGNGSPSSASTISFSLVLPGSDRVVLEGPRGSDVATFGTGHRLSGGVTCRGADAPFADVLVTETLVSGADQTFITRTDEAGRWTVQVSPDVNASYTAQVVDPLLSPAVSSPFDVGLRPFVTIAATPDDDGRVRVSGRITPAHPNAQLLLEYRRPGREWRHGPEGAPDAEGNYRFDLVLAEGVWEMRTSMTTTGDDDHVPGRSLHLLTAVGST